MLKKVIYFFFILFIFSSPGKDYLNDVEELLDMESFNLENLKPEQIEIIKKIQQRDKEILAEKNNEKPMTDEL